MEKTTEFRVVFVTTDSFEISSQLARIIVAEQLAACCTIIPNVVSVFPWDGSIQQRQEYMLIVKTISDKLNLLENRIREINSDTVPEIISLTLDSGSEPFLDWMKKYLLES